LAWCSHNSTCDDIAPTSCAHLMPARSSSVVPASCRCCPPFVVRSAEYVQGIYGLPVMLAGSSVPKWLSWVGLIVPASLSERPPQPQRAVCYRPPMRHLIFGQRERIRSSD
jgi:hypothetical protein